MIYALLRPLLFALPPEPAHDAALAALRVAGAIAAPEPLLDSSPVRIGDLTFPNRVGLAAGFDKNGTAVAGLGRLGFGFLEVGTVTPRPQPGNPRPRVFRLTGSRALINRMGFPNEGAEIVAARLQRRRYPGVLGVNIGKNAATPLARAVDDYLVCFRLMAPVADYIAINISSPNTAGLRELQDAERLAPILEAVATGRREFEQRTGRRVPVFLKIAPELDASAVADMAGLVGTFEIDGVIATNTTISRELVIEDPQASQLGGLSGPPLLPSALAMVRRVRSALPRSIVIGCGGIDTPAAAIEMRRAGADLVQLYTGLVFRGPQLVRGVVAAMRQYDAHIGG